MEIHIPVADEERLLVLKAINNLHEAAHIKSMSLATIAQCADMKATKVRLVVAAMMKEDLIEQYALGENKRVQRYYYRVTDLGKEFTEKSLFSVKDTI